MSELRKVEYTTLIRVENPHFNMEGPRESFEHPFMKNEKTTNRHSHIFKEEKGLGLFHHWGSDFEEFDEGPGNYTIGLIETFDGKMLTTNPSNIKFIKEE